MTGHPGPWSSFWRSVISWQPEKMTPRLALRNSIGVAIPLIAGVATGATAAGLIAATGALSVSFSDSHEPYIQRVRRMLAASVLVGLAVLAGELSGHRFDTAIAAAAVWAFVAGMLVSLSTTAADLGVMSLVTLVVFAAVPQPLDRALGSGALAFLGGALQVALAVAFWPVLRHGPERKALAELYGELARSASAPAPATEAPPASAQATAAHDALRSLAARTPEDERYHLLLSQAERMRLAMLALSRMRARIARDYPECAERAALEDYRVHVAALLNAIARALVTATPVIADAETMAELDARAEDLRRLPGSLPGPLAAMLRDSRLQMDALSGQLRSALDLAADATPEGEAAFLRREQRRPWRLRLEGTLATLRANLSLDSAAFRHAVRLAVSIAIGDALGRGLGLHRSYWLPMTIAIVLKPDFSATFSRGILRLAGTMLGLVAATGLFHVLPASPAGKVAAVTLLMYVLRWAGPANYGILVIAVTALLVFLLGLTGVSPGEVMAARWFNTLLGGVISLIAYAAWPTWERSQAPPMVAAMLDAYRDYFRAVRDSYVEPSRSFAARLGRTRAAARLARSNAEASLARLIAEPRTPAQTIGLLTGMMASSHRLVHAIMALEAGLASSHPVPARAQFKVFANDVEVTLHSLAETLRGSPLTAEELPALREQHHALVRSGDALTERYALVNVETDRITNSLNTLADQVLRWRAYMVGQAPSPAADSLVRLPLP